VSVRDTLGRAAERIDGVVRQPAAGGRRRTARHRQHLRAARPAGDRPAHPRVGAGDARDLLGPATPTSPESHADLATLFEHTGNLDEAEKHDRAGLAIRRSRFGARSAEAADSLDHLSVTLYLKADYPAAAAVSEEGLAIREALFGKTSKESPAA